MRLLFKTPKTDSQDIFTKYDLERLDGITRTKNQVNKERNEKTSGANGKNSEKIQSESAKVEIKHTASENTANNLTYDSLLIKDSSGYELMEKAVNVANSPVETDKNSSTTLVAVKNCENRLVPINNNGKINLTANTIVSAYSHSKDCNNINNNHLIGEMNIDDTKNDDNVVTTITTIDNTNTVNSIFINRVNKDNINNIFNINTSGNNNIMSNGFVSNNGGISSNGHVGNNGHTINSNSNSSSNFNSTGKAYIRIKNNNVIQNVLQNEIKTKQSKCPSPPPRKKSTSKHQTSSNVHAIKIEYPKIENTTVVKITSESYKLQIKNDFPQTDTKINIPIENNERKTSIMINGDDCYSTVNVTDSVPIYQSSVVVNDDCLYGLTPTVKRSSSVYITAEENKNFNNEKEAVYVDTIGKVNKNGRMNEDKSNEEANGDNKMKTYKDNTEICKDESNTFESNQDKIKTIGSTFEKDDKKNGTMHGKDKKNDSAKGCNSINGSTIYVNENSIHNVNVTEDLNQRNLENNFSIKDDSENNKSLTREKCKGILDVLKDPVEAVRRNLVPHVCGKTDLNGKTEKDRNYLAEDEIFPTSDSFLNLKNINLHNEDTLSDNSSTQYELVDIQSDCYTDNSNRSSITEDDMINRTKFYEMLADDAAIEVSEVEDHHYESIKNNSDPIYEEIEVPPPLPANPPPSFVIDDLNIDKEFTTR